eukprot:127937-Pleurochrysis_carterae.AAC.2
MCARLPMRHATCASHLHARTRRTRTLMHARITRMRAATACARHSHAFRFALACSCALHAHAHAPCICTRVRLTDSNVRGAHPSAYSIAACVPTSSLKHARRTCMRADMRAAPA